MITSPAIPIVGPPIVQNNPSEASSASLHIGVQIQNSSGWLIRIDTGVGQTRIQPFVATTVPVTQQLTIVPETNIYGLPALNDYVVLVWLLPNEPPAQDDGPLIGTATLAGVVTLAGALATDIDNQLIAIHGHDATIDTNTATIAGLLARPQVVHAAGFAFNFGAAIGALLPAAPAGQFYRIRHLTLSSSKNGGAGVGCTCWIRDSGGQIFMSQIAMPGQISNNQWTVPQGYNMGVGGALQVLSSVAGIDTHWVEASVAYTVI